MEEDLLERIRRSGREVVNFNKINFIRELGSGAFGEVWEVEVNGLQMACKIMSGKTFSNNLNEGRKAFLAEVEQNLNVAAPGVAMLLGISVD